MGRTASCGPAPFFCAGMNRGLNLIQFKHAPMPVVSTAQQAADLVVARYEVFRKYTLEPALFVLVVQ